MIRAGGTVVRAVALVGLAGSAAAQSGALTTQGPDQWRASKLVGLPIYGPNVTSVGKISDLLLDKDGRVQTIVIGIGGILGIGEKDVALPWGQVQFSNEPITPQPAPAPAQDSTPAAGAPAGGASSAAKNALAGADTPMAPVASDVLGAPSHSGANPNHGTVAMTIEQLRSAPAFNYAQ